MERFEYLLALDPAAAFDVVVEELVAGLAREVGVPEEHLQLFAGPTARFLLAWKR